MIESIMKAKILLAAFGFFSISMADVYFQSAIRYQIETSRP